MTSQSANFNTVLPTAFTGNGAPAYDNTGDHLLEFFSKAGSLFEKRGSFYGNESSALDLFKNAWLTRDFESCMRLLFWVRDARGGAGNRSGAKSIWKWLAKTRPDWVIANIESIPMYGRWDDLFALYNTPCEDAAKILWADYITGMHPLACKWADRKDVKLANHMKLSMKEFRKALVKGTNVVETDMCAGKWENISYQNVPSIAIGRYDKAFTKHDFMRYQTFKNSLVEVNELGQLELVGKVNAGAIFPYDLVRLANNSADESTKKLIDAQLLSMPNFMEGSNMRVLSIVDTSASMEQVVAGSIQAIDISTSLGLYCSEKIGRGNPFYRKVIPFSTKARFVDWNGVSFADAIHMVSDGYVGSTNIVSALDLILDSGKLLSASNDQMPNLLLIVSDMQFDGVVFSEDDDDIYSAVSGLERDVTPLEDALKKWDDAGYARPKIVMWNTAGYQSSPITYLHENMACVSGFSPSILTAILGGTDFSPLAIMKRALEKYPVNLPV